ncbi:MAG TPA: M48 family metallopeptidase [Nitrososphaera sp.]|nr:M48 family metallopeptidase [Nitrososphaera sp.]
MAILPSLVLISLFVLLGACSTNPLTQRRQILLTSEDQERALGEMQYRELLRTVVLNQDREANRLVRKIGSRIAQAVNRSDYAWEFVVVSDPTAAFIRVFPGGKVVVSTGVFPIVEDETGLALLLSHDAAHALARHQGEKAGRDVLMELGSMGVTFGPDLVRQAYNTGSAMGLILPFGQVQEAEADRIGLLLAAKAGYEPRAALAVWDRMAREGEKRGQPLQFLLTHPGYGVRRQIVSQSLPEALQYYAQARQIKSPEHLPPLASLEPADDTERSLTQAMGALDQLAAVSPAGHEAVVKAVAEELQLPPQAVEEPARSFTLRPGELAFVFTLAEASGKGVENLVATVEQTRSWPAVATSTGVLLSSLLPRMQAIAASAQQLAHGSDAEVEPDENGG